MRIVFGLSPRKLLIKTRRFFRPFLYSSSNQIFVVIREEDSTAFEMIFRDLSWEKYDFESGKYLDFFRRTLLGETGLVKYLFREYRDQDEFLKKMSENNFKTIHTRGYLSILI